MAGVDALLSCLRLEQYRAALEDAVRAAPRHAAATPLPRHTPLPYYPVPYHPAASLPCYPATLLPTHPPPSLSYQS